MTAMGWIGVGAMGSRMLLNVLRAGHSATLYSRRPDVLQQFAGVGEVRLADSPAAVAAASEATVTMVSTPADVEEVYFGRKGLLHGAGAGSMLIDMTTSTPAVAQRISAEGADRGVDVLDAPVSGGPVAAESGSLAIMVGGERATMERARPILSILGQAIIYHGAPGSGQKAKIANQILVANVTLGICEAYAFARASGLSGQTVLETLSAGIAGSSLLKYLWSRIAANDFEPGFRVEHMIKDLGIALDAAHDENLALAGTASVRELYHAVRNQGYEGCGTQALVVAVDPRGRDTDLAE